MFGEAFRRIRIFAYASMLAGLASGASAQAPPAADFERLREEMRRVRENYERQVEALETRLRALEQRPTSAAAAPAPAVPPATTARGGASGTDFQIGVSGTMAAGHSSVPNAALAGLQGGGHAPAKNGFNLQSAELFVGGSVDPYFDAQASVAFQIDADGETVVELEEVFFTTRSLPWGLQLKGGQYFTEFGRHNPQHVHRWDFVDQPVILSRLFGGDGLRSQGARIGWLAPLPWFSELYFGAQNAKGETVKSFLGETGATIGGHTLSGRSERNASDFLYSARWLNGFDVTETMSVNFGASGLYGPNATGQSTNTYIYGADLYAKWRPARTERGFPFVAFQMEALRRHYEAGDGDVDEPTRETLLDWGLYGQALYGFHPGWVAGLRLDYANGNGFAGEDADRDRRWRISPNLTWYPTEFSKLRLQYNRDWANHLETVGEGRNADTVWLQFEFSLGGHFAHTF